MLNGEILVHNHCYRGDEMSIMLDVAEEFGYKITAFHHAVEAYKVADLLAEKGTCAAMWADWWGFKMEAYDGIRENAALVERAGACAIIHSDDAIGIQQLNQETAKVMGAAARVGIDIPPETRIQWITRNAATSLGVGDVTGTLEEGKMADVVLWSGNPFSVYTRADHVYIDGALVFDRLNPDTNPVTDFSLGTSALTGGARMIRHVAALVLLFAAGIAAAQTTAIVGGTVHTVGPAGTLENATILIEDGIITAVGETVAAPSGARIINVAGKVVTPGLFTPYGQIGLEEVGFSAGPLDAVQRGDRFTARLRRRGCIQPAIDPGRHQPG